ncbi:5004_t:CDS:2, partial [Paraglomus occultum]
GMKYEHISLIEKQQLNIILKVTNYALSVGCIIDYVEDQRFVLSACDYAILRHKDDKSLLQLAQSVYEAMGKTPTDFGSLEQEKSIVSQLLVSNGSMDVDIQIPARRVCPICTSDILQKSPF